MLGKLQELRAMMFVDTSYRDCLYMRKSTMGEINTIGESIMSWMSQRYKSVSQSSTEAKYIVLSEATKELKIIQMLFDELDRSEYPEVIYTG